jgi:hypothetical protein
MSPPEVYMRHFGMFIRNKIKAKLALYYYNSIEDERSEEWELNDMEDWFLLHLQDKASTNICKIK